MKKIIYLLLIAFITSTGCRKIEVDGSYNNNPDDNTESKILEGRITSNLTLKSSNVYKLRGLVYVTNGAILNIEPGTKIVGESGRKGGLIITRSSKIIADGTAEKPIVFTSEEANPQRGDWAGVVILGNAPTNSSFNGQQGIGEIEGGINNSDGLGLYGLGASSNPADNSGILRYVRIEYAGYAFLPDKEINGLTFGGVGNGTIVDYVQVSYAADDSFEWFGGTVNCSHLISYKALDDDFDTDNGFSGKVQFGIALRDSSVADISKSEAFESDNDANGSQLTPQTKAIFSNFTVVGPKHNLSNTGNSLFLAAAQIRRNSSISIHNSIFMGWPIGLLIDASKGYPTDNNFSTGLNVQNTIISGCTIPVQYSASVSAPTGATSASVLEWFNTPAFGNTILNFNSDLKMPQAFNYSNPLFNPDSGSPALSGASFTIPSLSEFVNVGYRGAAGQFDDWYKGWSKFN